MFKFLKKKKTTKKTLKSPREDILDNMRNNLKEIDNFDKFTEVVVPLTGVHYHEDFCIDDIKKKSESAMKELSEEIIDHFGSRHPTKFSAIKLTSWNIWMETFANLRDVGCWKKQTYQTLEKESPTTELNLLTDCSTASKT